MEREKGSRVRGGEETRGRPLPPSKEEKEKVFSHFVEQSSLSTGVPRMNWLPNPIWLMTVSVRNTQDLHLVSTIFSKVVSLGGQGHVKLRISLEPLLESTLTSCTKQQQQQKTTNPSQSSNFICIYTVHVYVCVFGCVFIIFFKTLNTYYLNQCPPTPIDQISL